MRLKDFIDTIDPEEYIIKIFDNTEDEILDVFYPGESYENITDFLGFSVKNMNFYTDDNRFIVIEITIDL